MGRFEVLKTKKIIQPSFEVVNSVDDSGLIALNAINKKFGQYKSIVVCEVENGFLIVDGLKYFKTLEKAGEKKVLCFNLGKLKDGEYEVFRVALNVHQARLNYIGIAEAITLVNNHQIKSTTISNNTGINLTDVERYAALLDFDWNEFKKKPINEQFNHFEDER